MHSVEAEFIIKDYERENCSLDDFIERLDVNIISKTDNCIEFDIVNCHPSIANALRRTLIAGVPTMAIHNVSIYENSTVFPDEYIAHRIGLVPIDVDPEYFTEYDEEEVYNNVLNFKIHKINTGDKIEYLTSDDIEFVPIDGQSHLDVRLKPGVLICKMAPGNEVEMTLKAIKGTGEQHTKWSPVSLCSYRLMPRIEICKDFYGSDAEELQKCFSPGVIEIIDNKAVVVNSRLDSMSREVFRHEKFKNDVKIMRESGWFCFTVESLCLDPIKLVKMGLQRVILNCRNLKEEVKAKLKNCREE